MRFQQCRTELSVAAREDTFNASDLCIMVVVAHLAVGDDTLQILLFFKRYVERILPFPLECGKGLGYNAATDSVTCTPPLFGLPICLSLRLLT